MSSALTLIAVGHLGREPEMKFLANGTAVTTFSIATDRQYTKDGEKVKETTWLRVTVWGKQAEACNEYLHKGSMVFVEGTLTPDPKTGGPRVWANKEGVANANFEVNASSVRFLSTPQARDERQDGDYPGGY